MENNRSGSHYVTSIFIIFSLLSCDSNIPSDNQKKNEPAPVSDSILDESYIDIYEYRNVHRGTKVLDSLLRESSFDTSLFEPFFALSVGYSETENFDQADSIFDILLKSDLSKEHEYFLISEQRNLAFITGKYSKSLELLEKTHTHPENKAPKEVESYNYFHSKWRIFSAMEQCDSSFFYFRNFYSHLFETNRMIEIVGLEESEITKLEDFSKKGGCYYYDSLSVVLPGLDVAQ